MHTVNWGDGTLTNHPDLPDNTVLTGAQAIAVGDYHSCALMTTGAVRCWGDRTMGAIGDGATFVRPAPISVAETCNN